MKRREGSHTGATCSRAGKIIYATRKEAKVARSQTGSKLGVYICGDHYHIGHSGDLPRRIHRKIHEEQ